MHELIAPLLAARIFLAEWREDGEIPQDFQGDIEHPILIAEQTVCNIEYSVNKLVERNEIFSKTNDLIKLLQDAEVDYTLLMYLQVSDGVTKGKGFVSYLKGICEQHKVPYTSKFFYDAVWAHFTKAGVSSITPTKYLVKRNKEDILEEYKGIRARNDWAQHNPFFFQTFITVKGKGFQKLVFFITRTWQDGVIRMHEILQNGGFVHGTTMFDAHGVFEHVIDDESLASLILDSEILANAFGEPNLPKDIPCIAEEIMQFPSIIGTEMVAKGLLNEEDMLHVVVKDKTRPRGDTTKVSFHFVLCICAHKGHHKQCIELLLGDHKEAITAGLTHLKTHGRLPEDMPLHTAWYAFDAKAAISNGFTTAFSLKDKTDPHSRKHGDKVVCAGMQISETPCPFQVQDFAHLAVRDRLWLLQDQLYTIPKRHMLSYALEFDADDKQKKRPKVPGPQRADQPQHSSQSPHSLHSLHLPAWLTSAFKALSGREVGGYSSPSSLECKRSTLPKASQPNARLYQIPSVCCAGRLTKAEVHIHKTNCTVVAVDDVLGVVYMTCVTGAPGHKITEVGKHVKVVNMHSALKEDGKIQPVTEVKGRCIHWVMFDEEDMGLLIKRATSTQEPESKKTKTI